MAKDENILLTPVKAEADKEKRDKQGIGFDDLLRWNALGIAPTAPRLPEQSMMTGSMYGGYQKGYSNRLGAKGSISFHVLREVAQRSPILSAIVSTRQHQRMPYSRIARRSKKGEVGLRVCHRQQYDPKFKVPDGFKNLCRQVEEMIEHPWRIYWDEGHVYKEIEPSFSSFASKITEDLLVINRPCIELGLDAVRIPRAFGAIDGSNVIPTFAALKYLTSLNRDVPRDWETNYQAYRRTLQFISDKYKINLDERTEWIYVLAGRPVCGFRHDELIVAPMFPVTEVRSAGYPRSLVERALFIILAEIMAMTANSRYFEFGNMAETLVALKGNYNDKHIKDLESIFQGNMSGVNGMFRVPLIATPGGADDVNVIQLKQNHKDMLFDVYIQKLTNLACAVFRMHPSEINEAPRAGDNSGGLNQASQNKQIDMAQEQGMEANLMHEKCAILDPILHRIDPDLICEWDMGDSESECLQLVTQYAGITTVNERRGMMNMDEISDEDGGNIIDNSFIQADKQMKLQEKQAKEQAAQQQAMAQQPGQEQPQPGEEEEEEEQPEEEQQGEPPARRPIKGKNKLGKKVIKKPVNSKEDAITQDLKNRAAGKV